MNFIDDTPVSLSPVQFSKGLLAQLSLLKSQKIGFFTQEEKTAAYAVYEIFDNRVSSIKGNEAKSPRYRELLKIRNTLTPASTHASPASRPAAPHPAPPPGRVRAVSTVKKRSTSWFACTQLRFGA